MTVICACCGKIGEMPDPWPEDADFWERLSYRIPTVFCRECLNKLLRHDDLLDA